MEVLLILAVTAAIFCLFKIRNWWNFNSTTKSSQIPLGSFGIFPFVGETIHFISSAYSDRPESFVNKRRRTCGKVFKSHLLGVRYYSVE
ncbi:22alpha-hydroxysteroid 23-monooxygenase [Salvia divinorum]|uniref:22alpha-hydroxysteroid 23-monooxygenase n=1 Tax=Salvia divinorum TaxID=28513 RepID=A0ABD1G2A5_SALDI